MAKIDVQHILFLAILFASGCKYQPLETKDALIRSPTKETLESTIPNQILTATKLPTAINTKTLALEDNYVTPVPVTARPRRTPIFTQELEVFQASIYELGENIDQITTQAGGRWHIVLKEVDGPVIYTLLPEQRINIASVVKVPLAILLFESLEEKGIGEDEMIEYIQTTGTGGRTFDQLLNAMLVKSEEDATKILLEYIKESVNIPTKLREWELSSIDLDARRTTASEIAMLFERLYAGDFVSSTSQKLILDYLSIYTPNDDTRIGILRNEIPETYKIYNKRGSLLTPYVVADSAILENPDGKDYIITIFAYNSEPKTTYEILDQTIGVIALAFWNFLSTE